MSLRVVFCIAAAVLATREIGAETIVVDGQVAVRPSSIAAPSSGMSMSAVEAKFGVPSNKHAAVGAPPITRWDYANFAVYFEGNLVIHSVVTAS